MKNKNMQIDAPTENQQHEKIEDFREEEDFEDF